MVLRGPVNDLLTGMQPTPHLHSLSLSLSVSLFAVYRGEEEDQSYWQQPWSRMEWGGVCNLPLLFSKLAMISSPFIFRPSTKYFVNPSLSVPHTCTNADFDLELAGSSQWLGDAQGGGLWSWNRGQKQVLHHSNSPLHLELRNDRSACSLFEAVLAEIYLCFWYTFPQITGRVGSESPWVDFKGETECELDSQVQERRAHAGQYHVLYLFCTFPPVVKICFCSVIYIEHNIACAFIFYVLWSQQVSLQVTSTG